MGSQRVGHEWATNPFIGFRVVVFSVLCVCVRNRAQKVGNSIWFAYLAIIFIPSFWGGQSGHCPHGVLLFCTCEKGGCVPEYRKMCGWGVLGGMVSNIHITFWCGIWSMDAASQGHRSVCLRQYPRSFSSSKLPLPRPLHPRSVHLTLEAWEEQGPSLLWRV